MPNYEEMPFEEIEKTVLKPKDILLSYNIGGGYTKCIRTADGYTDDETISYDMYSGNIHFETILDIEDLVVYRKKSGLIVSLYLIEKEL